MTFRECNDVMLILFEHALIRPLIRAKREGFASADGDFLERPFEQQVPGFFIEDELDRAASCPLRTHPGFYRDW